MRTKLGLIAALAMIFFVAAPLTAIEVDDRLPDYEPVQGVSGTVKSVGSDTLNNLMTLWAEKFKEVYPNVQVEIEGKGSSTAPPARRARVRRSAPPADRRRSPPSAAGARGWSGRQCPDGRVVRGRDR